MICGVLFGRNKIVFFCNRNFDLCYTGREGEIKSLFTQSDVPGLCDAAKGGLGGVKQSRKASIICRADIMSFLVIAKQN